MICRSAPQQKHTGDEEFIREGVKIFDRTPARAGIAPPPGIDKVGSDPYLCTYTSQVGINWNKI